MLNRRPETGGDQQRAGLVAVQGDGMGLVVHPRPPDVGGRGMLQQVFFDRVLVEPGDGAQPPGGAGAATCFQVAGEAFDAGAADGEKVQGAGAAPGSELAQVQRVRLSGSRESRRLSRVLGGFSILLPCLTM
jgi:hypothetical protein